MEQRKERRPKDDHKGDRGFQAAVSLSFFTLTAIA
jgi:hypothetical protein